jgi:hypothetical protein
MIALCVLGAVIVLLFPLDWVLGVCDKLNKLEARIVLAEQQLFDMNKTKPVSRGPKFLIVRGSSENGDSAA